MKGSDSSGSLQRQVTWGGKKTLEPVLKEIRVVVSIFVIHNDGRN